MATSTIERPAAASAPQHDRPLPLQAGAELDRALEEANVQTLLMVYVHLTRDEAMLEAFQPHIFKPFSNPGYEIPAALVADLRAKLRHVLTTPGAARTDEPSVALVKRMMSIGVGEEVAEEFVPMMLDQGGFARPDRAKAASGRKAPEPGFQVLVIGAGLTGLFACIELERAGYDYVCIEKNEEVGGTWWKNRYPGVGVDTPSHFYSYSFEISPEWNHYHPHGADMRRYFAEVADKYDLRRHIRFGKRVLALKFDDASAKWNVTLEDVKSGAQETISVNAVFNAFGTADRWELPKIPGIESFRGTITHSAGYDESIDLKGKKVAVIGTGASSAQIVSAIAGEVGELTIFMRSKHWMINNPETMKTVPEPVKWAMRHIPHYKEWFRFRVFWFAADGLYPNVLKDPEWPADDQHAVSPGNAQMREWALGYMRDKLGNRPDLLAKLTPDFPIFSKRIIMDAGWFDALLQPNVTLEDTAIEAITPTGIVMKNGTEYQFDVIICATGFRHAKLVPELEIVGRGGRRLADDWADEEERAYLGTTVPGYPNYFVACGPNAGPNHAGGLNLVSESQVHYLIECLDYMREQGARTMEPTQEAFAAHNQRIDEQMPRMIWTHPKAHSYYRNSKGRPVGPWPWRLVDFWTAMRGPDREAYKLD